MPDTKKPKIKKSVTFSARTSPIEKSNAMIRRSIESIPLVYSLNSIRAAFEEYVSKISDIKELPLYAQGTSERKLAPQNSTSNENTQTNQQKDDLRIGVYNALVKRLADGDYSLPDIPRGWPVSSDAVHFADWIKFMRQAIGEFKHFNPNLDAVRWLSVPEYKEEILDKKMMGNKAPQKSKEEESNFKKQVSRTTKKSREQVKITIGKLTQVQALRMLGNAFEKYINSIANEKDIPTFPAREHLTVTSDLRTVLFTEMASQIANNQFALPETVQGGMYGLIDENYQSGWPLNNQTNLLLIPWLIFLKEAVEAFKIGAPELKIDELINNKIQQLQQREEKHDEGSLSTLTAPALTYSAHSARAPIQEQEQEHAQTPVIAGNPENLPNQPASDETKRPPKTNYSFLLAVMQHPTMTAISTALIILGAAGITLASYGIVAPIMITAGAVSLGVGSGLLTAGFFASRYPQNSLESNQFDNAQTTP